MLKESLREVEDFHSQGRREVLVSKQGCLKLS